MARSLQDILIKNGYVHLKNPFKGVYYRTTDFVTYVICFTKMGENNLSGPQQFEQMNEDLFHFFSQEYRTKVEILNLMLVKENAQEFSNSIISCVSNIWIVTNQLRLKIYENQPSDFDHMRKPIEDFLIEEVSRLDDQEKVGKKVTCPVTAVLIGINVLVYIILSRGGDVYDAEYMFAHGASMWQAVIYGHEYYRLFTCMFLHFGLEHLINNMFVLGVAGEQIEQEWGKIQFLVLYLSAGLIGSIVSTVANMLGNDLVVSAGASGAIYGLIGAIVFLTIVSPKRRRRILSVQILFIIGGGILLTLRTNGIDNWAHFGGFLGGFLICMLFSLWKHLRQRIN